MKKLNTIIENFEAALEAASKEAERKKYFMVTFDFIEAQIRRSLLKLGFDRDYVYLEHIDGISKMLGLSSNTLRCKYNGIRSKILRSEISILKESIQTQVEFLIGLKRGKYDNLKTLVWVSRNSYRDGRNSHKSPGMDIMEKFCYDTFKEDDNSYRISPVKRDFESLSELNKKLSSEFKVLKRIYGELGYSPILMPEDIKPIEKFITYCYGNGTKEKAKELFWSWVKAQKENPVELPDDDLVKYGFKTKKIDNHRQLKYGGIEISFNHGKIFRITYNQRILSDSRLSGYEEYHLYDGQTLEDGLENLDKRLERTLTELNELGEIPNDAVITVSDSLDAGNCVSGTRNFSDKLKISEKSSMNLKEFIDLALAAGEIENKYFLAAVKEALRKYNTLS